MSRHIELQSLVDTHERPFAVIDRNLQVVAVNAAYVKAYRLPRDQIIGRPCYSVLHHHDQPCFQVGEECPYLECYNARAPTSCLHTHYDAQDRARWVRISFYPLRAADGELFVGELLHEIAAPDEREEGQGEVRPVGVSQVFLESMEQLEVAARTDAPVLLIGETGTGKDLAAHFIHRYSRYRDHPFVALDCTVITESLFESEVFGHERGAFTGSVGAKKGLFEMADSGTLFVDEIGEATPVMQAKLLRVLETGQFRRLGGSKTVQVNARIVCATNRDLAAEVKAGRFREDLYYRIACFCVRIPPLRERLEDIPVLAESLLQRLSEKANRSFRLTREALDYLTRHDFPGNVRELRNMLQVAVAHSIHSPSGMITRERLESAARSRAAIAGAAAPMAGADPGVGTSADPRHAGSVPVGPPAVHWTVSNIPPPLAGPTPSLQDLEARHIADLLQRFEGNRRRVAKTLGISERTLYRKLNRYNLKGLQW